MYNRFDKGMHPRQCVLDYLLECMNKKAALEKSEIEAENKLAAQDFPEKKGPSVLSVHLQTVPTTEVMANKDIPELSKEETKCQLSNGSMTDSDHNLIETLENNQSVSNGHNVTGEVENNRSVANGHNVTGEVENNLSVANGHNVTGEEDRTSSTCNLLPSTGKLDTGNIITQSGSPQEI
eukprot:XP_004920308.3 PREDICTED: myotubularin-related protein 8-like [Xenopus tropicalis]